MALAATIGGLFGGASSALGSLMSYHSAKKLQTHQYELNQKALGNYYSTVRSSLNKAGYNPLLATGQSAQGFSANSAGVASDMSSGINSGVNSALATRQNKAQIQNTNANTDLVNQQAETEKAKRVQMEFQNAMTDVETHLKRKDLDTYDRRFYANLYEQMQRAENLRANSAVVQMNADTARMNALANQSNARTNFENLRLQRDVQVGESKYRENHPVYNWVDRWSKAVSPWANSAVSVYDISSRNRNYSNGYDVTTQRFDSKGRSRGKSTTSYRKR